MSGQEGLLLWVHRVLGIGSIGLLVQLSYAQSVRSVWRCQEGYCLKGLL